MTPAGTLPYDHPARAPGSLQRRLLWAAGSGIVLALLLVGLLLSALFRQQVQAELALRVQGQLEGLIGALSAPAAGGASDPAPLQLLREPIDPAFRQPFSGHYWWVQAADGTLLRSRSWWDHPLHPPAPGQAAAGPWPWTGPRGQALLVWSATLSLPGLDGPVQVAVAADRHGLDAATQRFQRTLAWSLGSLALALVAAAALQVRLGLAPLQRLRVALAQWRQRGGERLPGHYPAEVQPLVDDLNAVLADNRALVEAARQQTGNLAHALKTPLAVLGNAVQALPATDATLWRAQLAQMQRQVELHLVRARAHAVQHAATRRGATGTALPPLVDELLHTLGRLYAERGLCLQAQVPPGLQLAAGRDELLEMLGNLLDNACKWARGQVLLTVTVPAPATAVATALATAVATAPAPAAASAFASSPSPAPAGPGAGVCITVDDDGPGIAAADRERVLQRGQRLDETRPGSGLGLAIVDDLARLHGGSLRLDAAPLGGLRACLTLPATA